MKYVKNVLYIAFSFVFLFTGQIVYATDEGSEKKNVSSTESTTVQGEIIWEDHQNEDKIRPDFVEVVLLQNNKVVQSKTVYAEADNKWAFVFEHVEKLDGNLQPIDYKVDARELINYEVKVDGFRINSELIAQEEVNEMDEDVQFVELDEESDEVILTSTSPTDNDGLEANGNLEQLPKTGVNNSLWLKIIGGLMIVAALAVFIFFRTKPRK